MALPRSHLMIVINGLSPTQLADLGQQISSLPIPPIVTLVTTVPILNLTKELLEDKQAQARQNLATAGELLHYPAATKIVDGSNPRNLEKVFLDGSLDAMVKRGPNGQPSISVKNFGATGINELANSMPLVIDLSEHGSLKHSYKGVFAKPQSAATTVSKENIVTPAQDDTPKHKI